MSYTPTEWVTGDTITAEKLNKMESGIANAGGGGVFVVHFSQGETITADKTFAEVIEAIQAGKDVFAKLDGEAYGSWAYPRVGTDAGGNTLIIFNISFLAPMGDMYLICEVIKMTANSIEMQGMYGTTLQSFG